MVVLRGVEERVRLGAAARTTNRLLAGFARERQPAAARHRRVQRRGIGVGAAAEVGGGHAGRAGTLQGAGAAVVRDDQHHAGLQLAGRAGIHDGLQYRPGVGGEYGEAHHSATRNIAVWSISVVTAWPRV